MPRNRAPPPIATGGRPPSAVAMLRAHLPQRRGHALHRPLPQRGVARELAVERLAREQPHQQPNRRCPSCRGRACLLGAASPCGPTPSMRTTPVGAPLDRDAHGLERGLRREAVLAREKAADDRRPFGDRAEHQRAVRDRLVAGHRDSPADAIRRRRTKTIGMLRHALDQRMAFGNEPSTLNSDACAFISSSALRTCVVLGMAVEIEEEHVVPFALARRPRLDARHVDAVLRQRREQVQQHARRFGLAGRDEHRRLVLAARGEELAADDDEPRRVVVAVLDGVEQDPQAVDLARPPRRPERPCRPRRARAAPLRRCWRRAPSRRPANAARASRGTAPTIAGASRRA